MVGLNHRPPVCKTGALTAELIAQNGTPGGIWTHDLSLRRAALYPLSYRRMVPKVGFEPTHPYGYYALNVARLPFRHFGMGSTGLEPVTSCV
jgi:hypothetical protein